MNIVDELIRSESLPNGNWSWTLASRFAEMLRDAETRFGARDVTFTFAGIEFADVPNPYVWYVSGGKFIIIRLTIACAGDRIRACYQLAHETIHLLSPTGVQNANMLEEGVATLFAEEYVKNNFGIPYPAGSTKYADAATLAGKLLAIDLNAVKNVRAIQPAFTKISEKDLTAVCACPSDLAKELLQPF